MDSKYKTGFQSYEEANDFLYLAIDYEKLISYQYNASTFSLNRMVKMLEYAENPHKTFPSVHITGTKGKGSTSIMVSTVLGQAGLKTGLFTSPHLIDLRERIQINHQKISEEDFMCFLSRLRPYIQYLRDTDPPASPTFFEILTAVCMLCFKKECVDMAVLEVGLGGRLDSTNVVTPEVAVITNIGYDHTAILGNTLSSIAYEKAGIMKQNIPVLSAVEDPEALAVIEKTCKEKNAALYLLGRDLFIREVRNNAAGGLICTIETCRHTYEDIFLPLIGYHQVRNCALTLGVLDILEGRGFISVDDKVVREALSHVYCPARIEVVGKEPWIILDYAHTADSMRSLRKSLLENFQFNKLVLVLGLSQDKELDTVLNEIVSASDLIVVTKSANPRAASPGDLYEKIERLCGKKSTVFHNTRDAVIASRQMAAKDDLICITGSVYIAGEALQVLRTGTVE
ncbi:MAG: bifunctional folylpolyglutamate synthase/dihydrofolate synthase [Candidatus Loosdrechtia sp.]|uniref:bifunctional folylpolyglutamate synthase/dihydrofolate synthase n=1 Tax=Candidatus Loosdrechtia sp. TaxID=3101272 RepID=UPI003A6BFF8B|nr:MAG: folylpolyglutamate synthase/dihydrofolate synthase family protein [Candidatus Jettenia sp. AMX2]